MLELLRADEFSDDEQNRERMKQVEIDSARKVHGSVGLGTVYPTNESERDEKL